MTEDRNSHDGNSRDNAGGDQGARPDQPAHPQATPGHHPAEQFPATPQHPAGGPMGQQAYGAGYPQGNPYGAPHQPTQQFGQPQHGAPGHPGAQHAAGVAVLFLGASRELVTAAPLPFRSVAREPTTPPMPPLTRASATAPTTMAVRAGRLVAVAVDPSPACPGP